MKKLHVLLVAASALTLSACTDYDGGGPRGWGPSPYAYDGYYDGYYGPFYDGYWGSDGAFWYRSGQGDRAYRRGDGAHFRHDGNAGAHFQHFQGSINNRPDGVRMPHFGGGGHRHQGH